MLKYFNDLLFALFHGVPAANITASYISAFLGTALSLWLEVNGRNKDSYRTPVEFSFEFLRKDNKGRFLLTFILVSINATSGGALITALNHYLPDSLTWISTLGLGFFSDYIPMLIKQRYGIGGKNHECAKDDTDK